jgi:hypothetical protein
MTSQEYDTVLRHEETISPEEFIKRRDQGNISPNKVKIAAPSRALPFGGFTVELETPHYIAHFDKEERRVSR